MNSSVTTRGAISVRFADSITEEIEAAYDEITRRAYELFLSRSGGAAIDIEDWLKAEREALVKPPVRLSRVGDRVEASIDLRGMASVSVEIVVAGEMLLVHSLPGSPSPRIFRTLNLPGIIDARSASASVEGSELTFTADVVCNSSFKVS